MTVIATTDEMGFIDLHKFEERCKAVDFIVTSYGGEEKKEKLISDGYIGDELKEQLLRDIEEELSDDCCGLSFEIN